MDLLYLYRLPNYANYRDGQNRINGGHIEIGIMLIIEMAKIELIGGHIGFMLIIEIILDLADYRLELNRINWRPY